LKVYDIRVMISEALPIEMKGADGAPVRALLRALT
jgi:kynurenine formamidase